MFVVSHSKSISYSIIVHYINMLHVFFQIIQHMFIMKKVKKVQFASKTLLQTIRSKIWGSERIYENILTIWMNEFKIQFFFWSFFWSKVHSFRKLNCSPVIHRRFYFWDFHFILNISSISNNILRKIQKKKFSMSLHIHTGD